MDNLKGGTLTLEHHYRIDEPVERHDFVTRYRGGQLPFESPIWIKVYGHLGEEVGSELFDRLETAARRAHHVDGPGVLRTLDYGELERHAPFVISERVHDETLRERIETEGPLAATEVARLIARLGEALACAHEQELYHGSLAPHWITLGDDVTSAHIDHFGAGLKLSETKRATEGRLTPEAIGSVPPEHVEQGASDDPNSGAAEQFTEAADTYALGVVAYYACVGHYPFGGDDRSDASESLARMQRESPRPLEQFGFEKAWSEAVQRALHRDPDARWSSPERFAEQLERAAGIEDDARRPRESSDREDTRLSTSGDGAATDDSASMSSSLSDDREPGPASTLVTLAIAGLVVTNLAWFFYFMQGASRADTSSMTSSSESSVGATITSKPEDFEVYRPELEQKIGTTPVTFSPVELGEKSPLRLELRDRSSSQSQTRISLETGDSGPTFILHRPSSVSTSDDANTSP